MHRIPPLTQALRSANPPPSSPPGSRPVPHALDLFQLRRLPPPHLPPPLPARFLMDQDADPLYDRILKGLAAIGIEEVNRKTIYQAGLIIDCTADSFFVIADAELFEKKITSCHFFVGVQGRKQFCNPMMFHTEEGLIGFLCDFGKEIDCNLLQKINFCDQPVQESDSVHVYEGYGQTLTPGLVTGIERFDRERFSVSCNTTPAAGYGGLVIKKSGELLGMCCLAEYHLTARSTSALVDIIDRIRVTLIYRRQYVEAARRAAHQG